LGVEESAALVRFDLSTIARAEQRAALEAAAARLQASLALSEGPLMRAACFDLGAGQPGRLLLVIHHLAVDGVSWRVLLEDFQIAYRQLSRGEQIELPLKTTSYKEWAERLTEYAQTAEVRRECAYWLAPARAHVRPLPVDEPQGENSLVSVRRVSRLLTPDETQALLKEVPGLLRVQINDLLLTALAQAFAGWSGASSLLLNLESHGREEVLSGVDLTRTVGWFTTIAPLLLELNMHDTPVQQLAAVKEQLQLVPHRGIGYGLLRYLCADEQVRAQLAELPQAEVSFNYLGQLDQMLPEAATLKLATEATGPTNSGQGRRLSVFDINGLIVEGQLRFDWSYSENLHRRETVEALAQSFMDALRAFIASGQTPAPVLPAAAFTDFNWTQTDIAEIAAVLDKLE
jgi:non-ribosomal peptide synthase protein (TIGR01720 family)